MSFSFFHVRYHYHCAKHLRALKQGYTGEHLCLIYFLTRGPSTSASWNKLHSSETDVVRLNVPDIRGCHLHSTSAGSPFGARRQYSAQTMHIQSALPLHAVCTCSHSGKMCTFIKDKRYNVQTVLLLLLKYLVKVWGERFLNSLRKVNGLWKGNPAVKFSGVTIAIPKPFQVNAQDRRQGK